MAKIVSSTKSNDPEELEMCRKLIFAVSILLGSDDEGVRSSSLLTVAQLSRHEGLHAALLHYKVIDQLLFVISRPETGANMLEPTLGALAQLALRNESVNDTLFNRNILGPELLAMLSQSSNLGVVCNTLALISAVAKSTYTCTLIPAYLGR